VRQSPLGTSATIWPIVPALDEDERCECRTVGQKGVKRNWSTLREPSAVPLLPPQITWFDPRLNPVRRGGKPETNYRDMAKPPYFN
jgi:hypothetical protein